MNLEKNLERWWYGSGFAGVLIGTLLLMPIHVGVALVFCLIGVIQVLFPGF